MARSVVRHGTARCPRCQLPLRWCACAAAEPFAVPLAVDVLVHPREEIRPTSTSHLIRRALPATGIHVWRTDAPQRAEALQRPGRELWVLHPNGEDLPAGADPARVQVVLLDGNWRQAAEMLRRIGPRARRVALPLRGESRYWLRTQAEAGRFSTIEALLGVFSALGLTEARDRLDRMFETYVHAALGARGKAADAARYRETSRWAAELAGRRDGAV